MASQPDERQLPLDSDRQVYVSVKALSIGTFWLPEIALVKDGSFPSNLEDWVFLPAFAFLITHPTEGKVMFDLGIRKVSCSPGHPDLRSNSSKLCRKGLKVILLLLVIC